MSWWAAVTGGMILVAVATACSDSKSDEPEQGTAAEPEAQGDPSSSDRGTSTNAVNPGTTSPPACSVAEVAPIAEGDLSSLSVAEDAVYYVDELDGNAVPDLVSRRFGSIKRYDLSSGETTTVFAPQRSYPDDLLVTADSLYVASEFPLADVYRVPLSGQDAVASVSPAWNNAEFGFLRKPLLGVVGNELMVDGSLGVWALSLVDGSGRRLTDADSDLVSVQLRGSQLWYATDDGRGGIFRLDVSTPGSMPVEVYPMGCTNGTLARTGWFLASSSELACGGSRSIEGLAVDGAGATRTWDLVGLDPTPYYPAYSDADALYLAALDYGARLPRSGGNPEYFSCASVPVNGIGSNAGWFVWAHNLRRGPGVANATTPLLTGAHFSAIFATRR